MTERNEHDDVWLTKREFGDALKLSPRTVDRYISEGLIHVERVGVKGYYVRIHSSEVERLSKTAVPAAS